MLKSPCFHNRLDVSEASRVSGKRSRETQDATSIPVGNALAERDLYFFLGLNMPAAILVTKRRGTRRSPWAPR